METTIKINTELLAINSQAVEDFGFQFCKKDLKKRLKYLIKQNKQLLKFMEEEEHEIGLDGYALGDTINILHLIKKSL